MPVHKRIPAGAAESWALAAAREASIRRRAAPEGKEGYGASGCHPLRRNTPAHTMTWHAKALYWHGAAYVSVPIPAVSASQHDILYRDHVHDGARGKGHALP
eukprot:CAMPEP_0181181436 /NCGR_PEP_ID=MMETSP1096-20121128/7338_1 /TAXON_ID=156174 ORGANISM="Chrysochromulina ericina, Strain CCMP281" /NCGR_SAMPLE_ID=MMETSP1096 /ASSEMBLY_ACC=CAM_ASM_000453 /LENGTH=101 /DNA_ID=CAMNT_0023269943 /DNA_START=277 /DNA_END=581 /DNA_ORIENTATION=-